MRDPAAVRSALKALSGDERVDWEALASDVSGELSRSVLQQLQVIAQIADAHAAPPATFARVLPFRLAPGTLWGTLRLRSLVGSGADGDVYCAFDDRLQREVALNSFAGRRTNGASRMPSKKLDYSPVSVTPTSSPFTALMSWRAWPVCGWS